MSTPRVPAQVGTASATPGPCPIHRPTGRVRLLAAALCLVASGAAADGNFLQMDLGPDTADTVVAATRGKVSFGGIYSTYEGGWSAGGNVTRDLQLGDVATLKIGPSFGIGDATEGVALGGKLIVESYRPTGFGFVFLSGQYNTIANDWFTLAQVGNGQGLSVDLTAGGSDTYSEQAAALNFRLNDGPVSLRAGYRFQAESIFFGLSVNTY